MRLLMNHTSTISRREYLELEQSAKNPAPKPLSACILTLSLPQFELHALPRLLHCTPAQRCTTILQRPAARGNYGLCVNRNVFY